jgi:hypothetical protein
MAGGGSVGSRRKPAAIPSGRRGRSLRGEITKFAKRIINGAPSNPPTFKPAVAILIQSAGYPKPFQNNDINAMATACTQKMQK